jgi:ketosteroid isomerase-like protein
MRRTMIILCGLLAAVFLAGGGRSAGKAQSEAGDETKIIALENLWNQTQQNHDATAMEKMLDDDFVLTDYDGSVIGKAAFLESIRETAVHLTLEVSSDMKLHPHGNTVVVTGATREKGTHNGKAFEHTGRFTDTWMKKQGRWLCIASQLGVISK